MERRRALETMRSSSCSFVEVDRVGGSEVPDAPGERGAVASGSPAVAVELLEAVGVGQRGLGMATWQRTARELGVRPRGWVPAGEQDGVADALATLLGRLQSCPAEPELEERRWRTPTAIG